MKIFHCDHCGHLLFFENTDCVGCGHRVAYLPDLQLVASLDPGENVGDPNPADIWRSPLPQAAKSGYRLCQNYKIERVCNWALPADDPNALCASCRITRTIPNLADPAHRSAWYRLEVAKRRLIFTLLELGLPVSNRIDDPQAGLAFDFLADMGPGSPPVLTGHEDGVITVNVAEADDAEREKRRTTMHEPYRTLLGHMRHESGHYYWDRLIAGTAEIDEFRSLFGDDRADYAEALKAHYAHAPADWQEHCVSQYASSHPWEDWAETWAHYLHMVDTLETAAACGLSLRPRRRDEPALANIPQPVSPKRAVFERLIDSWFPLTYVMNNLNRGLGLQDAYPFVLSPVAVAKLKFIDDVVGRARAGQTAASAAVDA